MVIDWRSAFQQCTGTGYLADETCDPDDLEDLISTSSGEAETYAAADAAKLALHIKYLGEETGMLMPDKVTINIDAGAAMGFINNTGTIGRMKHIDLRSAWVDTLRDRKQLSFCKVCGEDNEADFFTKIHTGQSVKTALNRMMKRIP